MTCEDYRPWISAYVDDELAGEDRKRLEAHLGECASCRRELEELIQFKESLAMVQFNEPTDAQLDRYWSGVYNRLERGVGWILFSLGAILLLCWGAFLVLEDLLTDGDVPLAMKAGVVLLVVGVVVLLVSIARERLSMRKQDKYSQEVDR